MSHGDRFADVINDGNLTETLARAFGNIDRSAKPSLKGLFNDIDLHSTKLGNTPSQRNRKLTKLLKAVADLPLGAHTNDAFGDAYEVMMAMYASTGGRSGGQYFTPPGVSELLAEIATGGRL